MALDKKKTSKGKTTTANKQKKTGKTKNNSSEELPNVMNKRKATSNTTKMTFYVKNDLITKLYNFAYWDRYTITEAFNIVLSDGLKGKTTKPIKRPR